MRRRSGCARRERSSRGRGPAVCGGAESFTVEGDAASAGRVRLDTERKRLALVPVGGSVLLVR